MTAEKSSFKGSKPRRYSRFEVRLIYRWWRRDHLGVNAIAKKLGVNHSTISEIILRHDLYLESLMLARERGDRPGRIPLDALKQKGA